MMVASVLRDESSLSKDNSSRPKTRVKAKNLMFALFVTTWCLFAISVYTFFFIIPKHVEKAEHVEKASPQQTPLTVQKDPPGQISWRRPLPSSQDHHRLRHMMEPKNKWANRNNIVHVIQMRFMQLQPGLLHLGQARLDLFHAISLPSIMMQTSQDFLLIIRTDPNLHPVLKESMLTILRHVPNSVVVASNKIVEGFREVGMVDINETSVVYGSFVLVQSYHEMAQTHVVLETRLDADDALSLTFVDKIQRRAHKIWVAKKDEEMVPPNVAANNSDWRVWCPGHHINWHFYSPWDSKSMTGSLIPMSTTACITPGLTFGSQVNGKFVDIGVRQHHMFHSHLKKCEKRPTRCLERLSGGEDGEAVALRARAPTSAGMKDVVPTTMTNTTIGASKDLKNALRRGPEEEESQQSQYWASLPKLFGLNPASIWAMRFRIEANLPAIVADGLIGQCTGGHSCKDSSTVALRSLLNMSLAVNMKM